MITSHEASIYERSMELSEVGVVVFNLDLKRVFVDDTAAKIMGKSKEEMLDGGVGGGLAPEDRKEAKLRLRRCIETGQGTTRRVMQREVNGRVIYTAGHLAPLRDETGLVTGRWPRYPM